MLITDHDDWPAAEVIAAYRAQSEAEFSFRQMKDPHVVSSFRCSTGPSTTSASTSSPASWPCRSRTWCACGPGRAGLRTSVRDLLTKLADIGETILIYPAARGRPKARRMLTETTSTQDELTEIFQLDRYAPTVRS